MRVSTTIQLSDPMPFAGAMWSAVPNEPGVYVIADEKEVVYVGMAGRNGKGVLETDFAITHLARSSHVRAVPFPRSSSVPWGGANYASTKCKAACREYIAARCSFQYKTTASAVEARALENRLKEELRPSLNP
jgi:hypothetical protein